MNHRRRSLPAMSDAVFALTLALLLLAPLAIAGVALINAGLGRSRSAAQALLGNLALVAVAAIVFALVGATFAGAAGRRGPPSTCRQDLELARARPVSAARAGLGPAAGATCAALRVPGRRHGGA